MRPTMAIELSLLDDLEQALSSGSDERRTDILRRITDLFIGGAPRFSEEQVGVFDDIIGRLVSAIEAKARAKLATRLASISNAPVNVIRTLAFDDDIDVARPVLTASERLDDTDLVVSANTKSQQHLAAIAERKALSEAVTDVLVSRGDRQVVHSVAKNRGARFSDAGFRMLVKRASGDDVLASHVGSRPDIPRQHFLVLLDKASAAVRTRLMAENPGADGAVEGVLAEVVGGLRSEARNASRDFTTAAARVEQIRRAGRLDEEAVYGFARERKFEETAITLALLSDTPLDVVERALLDPGAEIVLILAKVAGLSSTSAKAILLLRTADRGMSAQDLDLAMNSFARLQIETARRVLSFYRARLRRPPTDAVAPPASA
jgi:uncharacterized protein (DUF2336 family)